MKSFPSCSLSSQSTSTCGFIVEITAATRTLDAACFRTSSDQERERNSDISDMSASRTFTAIFKLRVATRSGVS